MSDNAGVLDALAAIRGTDNLMMDMFTDPEFVEEGVQKLLPIYKQTEEELNCWDCPGRMWISKTV